MRPTQILSTVLALSSITAAWPWPKELTYKDVGEFMLYGRADGDNSNNNNDGGNQASATPKPTASGQATKTSSGETKSADQTDEPKSSGTGTTSPKSGAAETTAPPKTYGPTVQPGGVKLISPPISSGPQYYKIGDYVTFSWNYTSVKQEPTAVDVLATCSDNQQLYTIAGNLSGSDTQAVWNTTKDYYGRSNPLVMASYTLIIKQHDDAITQLPEPGYMAPYSMYGFAMYFPKTEAPLAGYTCATCEVNAGIANVPAHQTLSLAIGMSVLTVMSFTWFATNRFGIGLF